VGEKEMPYSISTSYLNNPKLKKAGVSIPFTMKELQEVQKCAADPIYFIRNYVKIIHVDKGEILFNMWDFQEKMIRLFLSNRFCIVKCPRQVGKSTTTVAYILHTILFKEQQNIAILANKYKTAQKLISDLKKSYMALPLWMQSGVVEWNKGNIELENGNKIVASATSNDAIRGNAYNLIFLDEFAHVPAHIAEDFFDSVYPTISSGETTQVIVVSTPKGMNKFFAMWTGANNPRNSKDPATMWNGYAPFAIHWRDVPKPDGSGLRDDAWKAETIARTNEQQFRQEFECEFIGSSNTLLSVECLSGMATKSPITRLPLQFSRFGIVEHFLDVHALPEKGHQYVLCADVAAGKNQDSSAFVIIDISKSPYMVVAKYKSNKISPMLFPDVISEAASKYNMAFVLVETNDNDVAKTLQMDLEYENLITTTTRGKGTQVGGGFAKNVEFGIRTNKSTKKIGCSNLKTLIEGQKLITHDYHIFVELTQFVSNNKGSYSAEEGCHDDLAMCLVNFGWLINQKYFKELTDSDVYSQLKKDYDLAMNREEMFGFFVNDGNKVLGDDDDHMMPRSW
jgi:Terminase large subunit, T4likevirus-type, N-terminal/Terminase RNaseH-like domain